MIIAFMKRFNRTFSLLVTGNEKLAPIQRNMNISEKVHNQ